MTFKGWLTLSLAVLLIHLSLLQSLPLSLRMEVPKVSQTFATRVIAQAPALLPPALPQLTKPAPKPQTVPVEPRTSSSLEQESVDAAPSPEPVASDAAIAESPEPEPSVVPVTPELETTDDILFSADGLPGSVKLVYQVESNKFPFSLRSELLWWQAENRYQARLSFAAFGQSRVQTSRGLIEGDGLAPERFSDKYRSEVAAHLNREKGLITFSANTPDVKLQSGAQDRLSVLVQLAALVASKPGRFTPGSSLMVQTVGPRDADIWLFTFGETVHLDLPGGPMDGIHLVRNPRQTYDQKVEIWLAPSLSYLPARIRITEANGDYLDQKWVASEAAQAP